MPYKAPAESSKTILDVPGTYKPLAGSQVNLRLQHLYRTLLGDELAYKTAYKAHRNFLTNTARNGWTKGST